MDFPKVLTNGGDYAIIYTVSGGGPQPIHGAYWTKEEWMITAWDKDGFRHSPECPSNLDITKIIKNGDLLALFPKQQQEEKTEGAI